MKNLKLWWEILIRYVPLMQAYTLNPIWAFKEDSRGGQIWHFTNQKNGEEIWGMYYNYPHYELIFLKIFNWYLDPDNYIKDFKIHKDIVTSLKRDCDSGKIIKILANEKLFKTL